jgi:hypothetical protein
MSNLFWPVSGSISSHTVVCVETTRTSLSIACHGQLIKERAQMKAQASRVTRVGAFRSIHRNESARCKIQHPPTVTRSPLLVINLAIDTGSFVSFVVMPELKFRRRPCARASHIWLGSSSVSFPLYVSTSLLGTEYPDMVMIASDLVISEQLILDVVHVF